MKFSFFRNVIVPIMFGIAFGAAIVGGVSWKDGLKKKQIEKAEIQRSERIQEMAEAIILADKIKSNEKELVR